MNQLFRLDFLPHFTFLRILGARQDFRLACLFPLEEDRLQSTTAKTDRDSKDGTTTSPLLPLLQEQALPQVALQPVRAGQPYLTVAYTNIPVQS